MSLPIHNHTVTAVCQNVMARLRERQSCLRTVRDQAKTLAEAAGLSEKFKNVTFGRERNQRPALVAGWYVDTVVVGCAEWLF